MGFLYEIPITVDQFDLTASTLPDFTTVCARKQAVTMEVWRVLLRLSVSLHELGDVHAIDATGFGRRAVTATTANALYTTLGPSKPRFSWISRPT